MESTLDRIVNAKRVEVERLRTRGAELRSAAVAVGPVPDFEAALVTGPNVAVIAEVKRRSPSAGELSAAARADEVAARYASAGVAAVSVLTESSQFGGDLSDLESVRRRVDLPLLRKDFTLDPLQVYEARVAGASAVLLIVRLLDDVALRELRRLAESLGLAALVEAHDEAELDRALASGARLIGINNRNLETLRTDLDTTVRLAPRVPADRVLIAESGIGSADDVARMAEAGAAAVLVGESLMRAADPLALARALAGVPRR